MRRDVEVHVYLTSSDSGSAAPMIASRVIDIVHWHLDVEGQHEEVWDVAASDQSRTLHMISQDDHRNAAGPAHERQRRVPEYPIEEATLLHGTSEAEAFVLR